MGVNRWFQHQFIGTKFFSLFLVLDGIGVPWELAKPLFEITDLFPGGQDNVFQYRIPALVTTDKGTLLAVCDTRVQRYGDPPNAIDQVMKHSLDNGRTWPVSRVVDPGRASYSCRTIRSVCYTNEASNMLPSGSLSRGLNSSGSVTERTS